MNTPFTLNVFLNIEGKRHPVGRLAYIKNTGMVVFEYEKEFQAKGFDISPFVLPLEARVFEAARPEDRFDPLQGVHSVFADSLPDKWGRRVMDHWFDESGIHEPTVLDRLAWIGRRGIGALEYEPALYSDINTVKAFNLRELRAHATGIIQGDPSMVVKELTEIGGSPGGAKPKYLMAVNDQNDFIYGIDAIPDETYQPCIVKVPVEDNDPDQQIEFIYSEMARLAGIKVPGSRLIEADNAYYFVIERFDRAGPLYTKKLHQHTLAGLLGIGFDRYRIGYEDALKLTFKLTGDQRHTVELYRRMVFNFLGHNCDDHSKNISYLMDGNGKWTLSPAYDLIYYDIMKGQHSMTVCGKRTVPKREDLLDIASEYNVSNSKANAIIDHVIAGLDDWPELAKANGLNDIHIKRIDSRLKRNLKDLDTARP